MSRSFLGAIVAVGAVALAAGCEQASTGPTDQIAPPEQTGLIESEEVSASANAMAMHNKQWAALRRATAPYHNFDKAAAAGWDTALTPCLEQLPDGAQGFHYGNVALIDGAVDLLQPEILQYEPQAGGHLRLVGVEYIVPLTFPEPPPILGQHFHAVPSIGLWALHVWVWRDNPSGTFADWNPKVSCKHAT